jgi:CubicO group peptidase (beta-lactamase class C family)
VEEFNNYLKQTQTTAFIVIKDDEILFEGYYNGYSRNSIQTSFSIAKSFISALVGIAIDEGYIDSIEDPITKYIPELSNRDERFHELTIRHLLTMSSGLQFIEGTLPWQDEAITYFTTNVEDTAINKTQLIGKPGKEYHYNNYNSLLIGLMIERATGQSVCNYFEEKIWKPLGMEATGSWNLDSSQSEVAKMESGINARAIDFAKLGRLYLKEGNWEGVQIISKSWVNESTRADTSTDPSWHYQYFWRVYTSDQKNYHFAINDGFTRKFNSVEPLKDVNYHFAATGKYGQFIYIIPEKDIIFIRFGKELGFYSWYEIFEDLAKKIN